MYLVFACDSYYPSGGWDDFKFGTDDLEEAKRRADETLGGYDWIEIVEIPGMYPDAILRLHRINGKRDKGWHPTSP